MRNIMLNKMKHLMRFFAPLRMTNIKQSSSPWQLRPNDGQGPYTKYFANFVPRKIEATFYEFLREAIPIIDAAINRLVSLDGYIEVEGDNEALVEEIKEWIYNVKVNDMQNGLQAFHQNFTNEAFEQGFAIGEFVANKKRNDIIGLRVADSKWVKFKRSETGMDIYQKSDNDLQERLLIPDNLLYFSINNENQNPYGTPLMRSCEFVSKILATMQNSLGNVWERFGDPSYLVIYKTSKRDGADLVARRKTIEDEFNTAIRAKREGKSADFIRAIDTNSEIKIDVIGAADQLLEFEVPSRHILEQIIAKTGLPPWMLGMHWSTTERLSDVEAEMLLSDVNTRQSAKMPTFFNLVRSLLLLRGRTWKKNDWTLKWAQVNLRDILKQAQARFMNAQADMYDLQNGQVTGKTASVILIPKAFGRSNLNAPARQSLCSCGKNHTTQCGAESNKELRRPTPWPELDKVETDYENELKYEWNELKSKMFLILKLNEIKSPSLNPSHRGRESNPSNLPLDKGRQGRVIPSPLVAYGSEPTAQRGEGKGEGVKEDIPGLEGFAFTPEQRAMVMQAYKDWLGTFDIKDENSAVRWYYGQAYSLGLIQAVKLIGKERPILDIIKNTEIFNDLCKNGFQLLKDNATKAIVQKIMPAMEAHMIAGTGPVQVASVLERMFGDQNSDWERLARTEMSSAAERAKLDEWKEWDVKKVEFTPAPDACPICLALSGVYDVGQCPIPGTGTHPRCRCSIRPAESEVV